MTLITVFSPIGGVGKTTTATNLSYLLAQNAPTVLLDLDTTGGATSVLNLPPAPRAFQWFTDDPIQPLLTLDMVITNTQHKNLDLLPGNYRTEQITNVLNANRTPEAATVRQLRIITSRYHYTVADVTAAAGSLRDICINNATYLVIPVHCAMRDIDALTGLMQSLPTHLGIVIVPTAHDARKTAHRNLLAYLEEHYGGYLLTDNEGSPLTVPNLTEIEQAAIQRKLVCAHAPNGRIAKTYQQLAATFTAQQEHA